MTITVPMLCRKYNLVVLPSEVTNSKECTLLPPVAVAIIPLDLKEALQISISRSSLFYFAKLELRERSSRCDGD